MQEQNGDVTEKKKKSQTNLNLYHKYRPLCLSNMNYCISDLLVFLAIGTNIQFKKKMTAQVSGWLCEY